MSSKIVCDFCGTVTNGFPHEVRVDPARGPARLAHICDDCRDEAQRVAGAMPAGAVKMILLSVVS